VAAEIEVSERICLAVGPDASTLFASAVSLSDCLSDYLTAHQDVYHAAIDAGIITRDQWNSARKP
jgi:hypothetical protein